MSKEAMRQALEALVRSRKAVSGDLDLAGCAYGKNDSDGHRYADAKTALVTLDKAITALREALAEQPAQQEPVDKKGSPCPEFWDWLPKAYNFEGIGNFTKYNMEVAFLAGMQTTHPPAQRTWVSLTDEEIDELSRTTVKGNKSVNWLCRAIEAKLKEKNT